MSNFMRTVGVLSLAAIFSLGCSGPSHYTSGERGRTLSYELGRPVFDIEASPAFADTGSTLEVYISVLGSSLTYYRAASGYVAAYALSVRLLEPEKEVMLLEQMWPETVMVASYSETQANATIRFAHALSAPPGKYLVQVQVEDRQSQKVGSRYQLITLHAARGDEPALGRILLFWTSEHQLRDPVTAFHIPERPDSLTATIEAYHLHVDSSATARVEVLRYMLDTAMATPPFYYYGSGGMMTEGRRLYPKHTDTLFRTSRILAVHADHEKLVFRLPSLPRGMYRLAVSLRSEKTKDAEIDEAGVVHRYFSVMPASFPSPVALGEMVKMLGYVATEAEKADLDSSRTPGEMQGKFEEFWLRHVKDRRVATTLIKKYYSRVDEANRLFSTFKEGWKTDRGLLYIVLGPPEYVEKRFDTELWYYSHQGSSQENIFQFRRVFFAPNDLSIEEYVLYRSGLYQVFWDRMVDKLREGEVF